MKRAIVFLLVTCAVGLGQRRFESGPFKGFTVSPNEHIVVELEEPFVVHDVKGVVLDPSGGARGNALVELRSTDGKIRAVTTGSQGRFQFRRVPDGEYTFKVTLMSFQSVVGVVKVRRKTKEAQVITITLPVGV